MLVYRFARGVRVLQCAQGWCIDYAETVVAAERFAGGWLCASAKTKMKAKLENNDMMSLFFIFLRIICAKFYFKRYRSFYY